MTENKRYTKEYFDEYNNEYDFIEKDILTIFDNASNKKYFMEFADDDEMNNIIDELINRLNEQEETIKELELENAKHIGDGEWDIRDITYGHGKFRLEEWGERYHQFYDGDKPLEDEEVVSLLFENEKLKEDKEFWKQQAEQYSNELEVLKHELLCKQLDKAPKEPVNCKCYYGDVG